MINLEEAKHQGGSHKRGRDGHGGRCRRVSIFIFGGNGTEIVANFHDADVLFGRRRGFRFRFRFGLRFGFRFGLRFGFGFGFLILLQRLVAGGVG